MRWRADCGGVPLRHHPGPRTKVRFPRRSPGDSSPRWSAAVSDIALKRGLPPELDDDLMAYVGCIADAIMIEKYRRGLGEAGSAHVEAIDSGSDLNAYAKVEDQSACCQPPASPATDLAVVDAGCSGKREPKWKPGVETGLSSSAPAAATEDGILRPVRDRLPRRSVPAHGRPLTCTGRGHIIGPAESCSAKPTTARPEVLNPRRRIVRSRS